MRHRYRIEPPSVADVESLARLEGIELKEGKAADLLGTVAALVEAAARAEERETLRPELRPGRRDPGRRPSPEEDPYNAFIRRCLVEGAPDGPLAGRTVAVKDNIAVGGVPMTEGSHFPVFVPSADAVVVERVLDAGGTIIGTLNMDELGGGATGVMSAFGPARNPVDPARSAGGSSGGAGSAVRSGAVDVALGVDQGGSARIPAAFCGVVAAKATHGLVPSWGIVHIDHTIDFVTPLARTVAGAALLLEVIAGEDWRDAQWVRGSCVAEPYTETEGLGVEGLRIGVVRESVDPAICEPAVLENLASAAAALAAEGAEVGEVSIPLWQDGLAIFLPYVAHLFSETFRSEGQGYGHLGAYDVEAMEAYAATRRDESARLAEQVKAWLIADRFVHERLHGVPYARLHNARLALRRAVSSALEDWDLLLTPTLPITAPRLLDRPASFAEISSRTSAALCFNTAPLNLTGHAAISVPSGADAAGLPTAVQIVSPHFRDAIGFRAAFALERALGPFVAT